MSPAAQAKTTLVTRAVKGC